MDPETAEWSHRGFKSANSRLWISDVALEAAEGGELRCVGSRAAGAEACGQGLLRPSSTSSLWLFARSNTLPRPSRR